MTVEETLEQPLFFYFDGFTFLFQLRRESVFQQVNYLCIALV